MARTKDNRRLVGADPDRRHANRGTVLGLTPDQCCLANRGTAGGHTLDLCCRVNKGWVEEGGELVSVGVV